jgi:hypothetical protein
MMDREQTTPRTGESSRRDVVKKMAYAAPFVLSLAASPAFASSGSCGCPKKGSKSPKTSGTRPSVNN